jgi:e3 binding domain
MASRRSESQREKRPAVEDDGSMTQDEEYAPHHSEDRGETYGDPDVVLDVPKLGVEEANLEIEDLEIRVALRADLADLVHINIGLEAEVTEVKLGIKGVEAQAQLKARLDNVRAIFSEVLDSMEHSPQFFRQALASVNETEATQEDKIVDTAVVDETGDVLAPQTPGDDEAGAEPNATEAARKKASELGVDLSNIEGSGSGGRIVVRDVTRAAEG